MIRVPDELVAPDFGMIPSERIARAVATSDTLDSLFAQAAFDETVYVPAGVTPINGQNRVRVLLVSRPVPLYSRKLAGSYCNSVVASTIKAAVPMSSAVHIQGASELRDIWIDGDMQANRALDIDYAHDCAVERIQVFRGLVWGMHVRRTAARFVGVNVFLSTRGLRLVDCNASTLYAPIVSSCSGTGLEIAGIGASDGDDSGYLSVFGGTVGNCGSDGVSPSVVVDGVHGCALRDMGIEAFNNTSQPLLHVRGQVTGLIGDGLHFVGAGPMGSVYVESGRSIRFRDCTAPTGGNLAVINRDAESGYDVEFIGCRRDSYPDPSPWTIHHVMGPDHSSVWNCESWSDGDHAALPPPSNLRFRVGKRVLHRSAPKFWVCTGWTPSGGYQWAES